MNHPHFRGPRAVHPASIKPACHCGGEAPFDPEAAHRVLAQKVTQLSGVLAKYMEQAPLERPERNANAAEMAKIALRIVGGQLTNDFPDCCLVGRKFSNGTFSWFCSGVLVHPRIVLTAGHCHGPGLVIDTVAFGTSNQNQMQNAEIASVRAAVTNPLYLQSNRFNDITVLILRHAAQTIPTPMAKAADLNAAQETTLVGFGNSDLASTIGFGVKREVDVDLVAIRRTPQDDLSHQEAELGLDSNVEFVAGGEGHDSCNGDSGGPAYIRSGNKLLVAGLTSRATDTATHNCGDGGIYTRVDSQLEFIRKVAADQHIPGTIS